MQNIECEAIVPSSFDWKTEPVEYFNLYFTLDLLDLILQETILNILNGNEKKMQNMPPTKTARIMNIS